MPAQLNANRGMHQGKFTSADESSPYPDHIEKVKNVLSYSALISRARNIAPRGSAGRSGDHHLRHQSGSTWYEAGREANCTNRCAGNLARLKVATMLARVSASILALMHGTKSCVRLFAVHWADATENAQGAARGSNFRPIQAATYVA